MGDVINLEERRYQNFVADMLKSAQIVEIDAYYDLPDGSEPWQGYYWEKVAVDVLAAVLGDVFPLYEDEITEQFANADEGDQIECSNNVDSLVIVAQYTEAGVTWLMPVCDEDGLKTDYKVAAELHLMGIDI